MKDYSNVYDFLKDFTNEIVEKKSLNSQFKVSDEEIMKACNSIYTIIEKALLKE